MNNMIKLSEIIQEIENDLPKYKHGNITTHNDYIGGIVDGEVRAERVATGKVKFYMHNNFPGLFSGQNNTNWRYYSDKNVVMWNIPSTEESKMLVDDFLLKRGINNPKHKSMYSESENSIDENMTYDDLVKLTTDTPKSPENGTSRIDRSKNVNVRSIPVSVEENQEQWNFRYKSSPQSTITNKPFEGTITFLKGDVNQRDDASQLECKVDCGCPDYKFKFAYNNTKQNASQIGPNSLNKCINRQPRPAYDIGEGLCKHLTALGKYLQTKISTTKKNNLFEAVADVIKQGPFNIEYYD